MRKLFTIDKWEYEIIEAITYGYNLTIFRNGKEVYTLSGFGSIGNAEAYAKRYIIESQFNIEL